MWPLLFALCAGDDTAAPPHPPLTDLQYFPRGPVVAGNLAMNRALTKYLKTQRRIYLHRAEAIETALEDARYRFRCWDALGGAQDQFYSEDYRRRCLAELRRLIGESAYHLGQMPPSVPYWTFPEID